jgi:DNA-binding SARP family transcriptional activator
MTSFGVLGPLRVMHAGETVKLGGPKQRTLLAALLLRARRPVSCAGIVDALWGGCPPASGAANVHTHVNRLRGAFANVGLADLLVTERGGYRLLVEPDQLDSETFEAAAERGRAALAAGDACAAVAFWQEAWAVWRGDPLEDVPTAGWLDVEAMRLADLAVAAREDFADARLAAGQYAALVAELTPLARAQPLREGLWRRLMLAQFRLGQRAEALETYRSLRGALVEELGVEPCGEIQELHQRILRDRPAGNHVRPMQLPPDAENFTGRRAERAEFRRLLTTRPRPVAAITGKAGVAQAAMLYSLGWVAHRNKQPGQATDYFHQALRLYEKLDLPMPQARVRTALHTLGLSPPGRGSGPSRSADTSRRDQVRRELGVGLRHARRAGHEPP